MKLRDLFSDDAAIEPQAEAVEVKGLSVDSRAVKPGDLFFALAGSKTDGSRFVDAAMQAGAVAVAGDHAPPAASACPLSSTPNPRRALALAAARFYPRQPATIAAVTGTSGKTSVAAFTRQIWERLGHASASIGTIGLVSPKRTVYGSLTTPDPIALHRQLDEIAGDGVTHLAFEASSHGLDQFRLDGVRIAAGGFTNLTRDHMDYHPDVAHYLAAKLRLFRDLVPPGGAAVISADHDCSRASDRGGAGAGLADHRRRPQRRMAQARAFASSTPRSKVLRKSSRSNIAGAGTRSSCRWSANSRSRTRWSPPGLRSAPAASRARCLRALEHLEGAKGRLERVGEHNGAPIFVDYAHKPDALAKALQALRPYAKRKLVVIFGAGGDRDAGKRPIMGAIAAENADSVIVTDDNPRSENPATIRAAILAAAKGASDIGDRAEAITAGIAALQPGDALLDRRQGARDRADRRRQGLAVQRSRGGGRRARSEGGMSTTPLWTIAEVARALGLVGRISGYADRFRHAGQPAGETGLPVRGAERHAERRLHLQLRQRARRLGVRRQGASRRRGRDDRAAPDRRRRAFRNWSSRTR